MLFFIVNRDWKSGNLLLITTGWQKNFICVICMWYIFVYPRKYPCHIHGPLIMRRTSHIFRRIIRNSTSNIQTATGFLLCNPKLLYTAEQFPQNVSKFMPYNRFLKKIYGIYACKLAHEQIWESYTWEDSLYMEGSESRAMKRY